MSNNHKDWARRRIARRLHHLRKLKERLGCSICNKTMDKTAIKLLGFDHPAALHFAHVDPMTKSPIMYGKSGKDKAGAGISRLYRRVYKDPIKNREAIKLIFEEIRKCEILCGNHHNIQTYNRQEYDGTAIARARAGIPEPPPDTQQDMFI